MDRTPKILIVDDDPLNVKLIRTGLSLDRYDFVTAFDGTVALQEIKANPPDLILLDIMMPGLNGWELTKILKNDLETMHIPIILITALDNISEKIKGLDLGADEYLGKPINFTELRFLVKSMLALKLYLDDETDRKVFGETECSETDRCLRSDSPFPPSTILMVEDDSKAVKILESCLQSESYRMLRAETGEKAIGIAGEDRIDLVLLDILLPKMTGFEVIEQLKRMRSTRGVPIIAITILECINNRIKAIELGANAYLTKPVHRNELKIRVRNMLRRKGPVRSFQYHSS